MLPPLGGALTGGGGTASLFKLAVGAGLLAVGLNSDINYEEQAAVVALVAGSTGLIAAVPALDRVAQTILAQRRIHVPAGIPRPKLFRPKPKRLHKGQPTPKPKPKPSRTERVHGQPTKTKAGYSKRERGSTRALYGAALCTMVGFGGASLSLARAAHVRKDTDGLDDDTLDYPEDTVTINQRQETTQEVAYNDDDNNNSDYINLKTLFHTLSFLFAVKKASDNEQQSLISHHEVIYINNNNDSNDKDVKALSVYLALFSAIEEAGVARSLDVVWCLKIFDIMDATLQLAAFDTPSDVFVDYSNNALDIPLPEGLFEPSVIFLRDFLTMFRVDANRDIPSYLIKSALPFSEWTQASAISSQLCTNPQIHTRMYWLWKSQRLTNFANFFYEDYIDGVDADYLFNDYNVCVDSQHDGYTDSEYEEDTDTYDDFQSDEDVEHGSEDVNEFLAEVVEEDLLNVMEEVAEQVFVGVIEEVVEDGTESVVEDNLSEESQADPVNLGTSVSASVNFSVAVQERVEEIPTPSQSTLVKDEVEPVVEQIPVSVSQTRSNNNKKRRSGRRSHVRAKGGLKATSSDTATHSKHI